MTIRYIIHERYEFWGSNGKEFTKWFWSPLAKFHRTLEDAKAELKEMKEFNKSYIKATKLKREYDIREVDVETFEPPKPHYSCKGRPSKAMVEAKKQECAIYWLNR